MERKNHSSTSVVRSLISIKQQQEQLRLLLESREEELSYLQQTEKALASANEQLQAVIDAVPGFISWIGDDLCYRGINRYLAEELGVTPETFVGKPVGFLSSKDDDFTRFIQDFFENSSEKTKRQVISIMVNNTPKEYLMVAQKYNDHRNLVVVGIDITERKHYQRELEQSLHDKELLLKEIHHRVKNNLFVVSSLLEMQRDCTDDEKVISVLNDSQSRVYSMALIHEKLYRSTGLNKINFKEYLEDLVASVWETYLSHKSSIELELNLESIHLNLETANPCGLIVNEMISNALKHGFPDKKQGKVWLSLWKDKINNQIKLQVADNGIGLPENFKPEQVNSLGMELVLTLVEQLQGEFLWENKQGASFTISFQEIPYGKRY